MRWPLVWRHRVEQAAADVRAKATENVCLYAQLKQSERLFDESQSQAAAAERRYDALMDRHNEASARADATLHAERQRYESLLSRYHMLRLQGASEAPSAPAIPERPAPDPVTTAINEASAGKDAKVRKAMLEQVKRDRNAGLSDTDIIARIQRGNRVADELEPVQSVESTQNPSVSAAAS